MSFSTDISSIINLHQQGYAHSVEVWLENQLVGGLYGLKVNRVFCGESMFSHVSNASKAALIFLSKMNIRKAQQMKILQNLQPFLK